MAEIRRYFVSTVTIALIAVLLVSGGTEVRQAQAQGTRPATTETGGTKKTEAATKPGAAKTLDPWFMLSDFSAVLIVRPADLVENELVRPFPIDVLARLQNLPAISADQSKFIEMVVIGVRPDDDLTTLLQSGPDPTTLKPLVFVRTAIPFKSIPTFVKEISGSEMGLLGQVGKEGKTWWTGNGGQLTVVKLDDRTIGICFGDSDAHRKILLDNKRVSGPLTQRVSQVDSSAELALVVALDRHHASLDKIYSGFDEDALPQARQFTRIAKNVNGMSIQISLKGKSLFKLDVDAREITAVPVLKHTADEGVASIVRFLEQVKDSMGSQSPDAKPLFDFADELLGGISVTQSKNRTTIEVKQPTTWQPALEALKPLLKHERAALLRGYRLANLLHLALSVVKYHEAHESFPQAFDVRSGYYDAQGKRIHGWRTHVLPFLEQADLYNQLDPKSPWTSPKNKPFAAVTPESYISEGVDKSTGKTRFVTLTGPETLWPEKPLRFQEVTDGLENTILFIEVPVEKAVAWTSSHDIPFDPKRPLDCIGKMPEEGLLVAMGDGSLYFLRPDITAGDFKALVTPQGGEVVDLSDASYRR